VEIPLPAAPEPTIEEWTQFSQRQPETSDYFHTWPCEYPDGRGCWFNHKSKVWYPYDSDTPAPDVAFYRPILRGPE
jgi:hypothetical protein